MLKNMPINIFDPLVQENVSRILYALRDYSKEYTLLRETDSIINIWNRYVRYMRDARNAYLEFCDWLKQFSGRRLSVADAREILRRYQNLEDEFGSLLDIRRRATKLARAIETNEKINKILHPDEIEFLMEVINSIHLTYMSDVEIKDCEGIINEALRVAERVLNPEPEEEPEIIGRSRRRGPVKYITEKPSVEEEEAIREEVPLLPMRRGRKRVRDEIVR
jgi:transposase